MHTLGVGLVDGVTCAVEDVDEILHLGGLDLFVPKGAMVSGCFFVLLLSFEMVVGMTWQDHNTEGKSCMVDRIGEGVFHTVKPLELAQMLSPAALMIAALSM